MNYLITKSKNEKELNIIHQSNCHKLPTNTTLHNLGNLTFESTSDLIQYAQSVGWLDASPCPICLKPNYPG